MIHSKAHMRPGDSDEHANYEYYRECFGDLETIEQSRNNSEVLVDEILAEGKRMPEIYMACGSEDFLVDRSRFFHQFLEDRKVKHYYFETKGGHDVQFWDEYAKKFVIMMFDEQEK